MVILGIGLQLGLPHYSQWLNFCIMMDGYDAKQNAKTVHWEIFTFDPRNHYRSSIKIVKFHGANGYHTWNLNLWFQDLTLWPHTTHTPIKSWTCMAIAIKWADLVPLAPPAVQWKIWDLKLDFSILKLTGQSMVCETLIFVYQNQSTHIYTLSILRSFIDFCRLLGCSSMVHG